IGQRGHLVALGLLAARFADQLIDCRHASFHFPAALAATYKPKQQFPADRLFWSGPRNAEDPGAGHAPGSRMTRPRSLASRSVPNACSTACREGGAVYPGESGRSRRERQLLQGLCPVLRWPPLPIGNTRTPTAKPATIFASASH